MCGISAIVGDNCSDFLIKSLTQLQNRGYDSAGISTLKRNIDNTNDIITTKYVSHINITSIDKLKTHISIHDNNSKVGIAHTRWATHGEKSDIISHPHNSNNNTFSLIHNGIIDNYIELKTMLITHGYRFRSRTDSEVIVNLLEYYYTSITTGDIKQSIELLNKNLKGTWAIVFLYVDTPYTVYATRNENPIVIGKSVDNHILITSEEHGFCNLVKEYIILDNFDICICSYDPINEIYSIQTNNTYTFKNVNTHDINYELGDYPHWTIKEILEQPQSILKTIIIDGRILDTNIVKLEGLDNNIHILSTIENLLLIGCGTSFNAGMMGKHYFLEYSTFNTIQVIDGSEFTERDIPRNGKTCAILLSQSGETKDLHRCIELAKSKGIFLMGVINVRNSLISREVDCGCYLNIGREVAVASTKSYTSQVVMLSIIAKWFSQIDRNNSNDKNNDISIKMNTDTYFSDIRKLYIDIKNTLHTTRDKVKEMLHFFRDCHSLFILGKGRAFPIAKEASLKIKEISYIHAEDYPLGALKHGPFALLTDKTVVIILCIGNESINKVLNCYNEVEARNATIIVISDKENIYGYKNFIKISYNNTFGELLSIIPLQLLAYELSISRNINPDIPRNLAKVVTVE